MSQELEPRVSVLEKGQEALQRDISSLSDVVKEQGAQLTEAISKLADLHITSNKEINEKISSRDQTNWQTIFAGISVIILIVAALFTPVWMGLNHQDYKNNELDERIDRIENHLFFNVTTEAKT